MLGVAAVAGWFAASFDVLALDDAAADPNGVIGSTAQLGGVLLVSWLVATALDEDRASGWTPAIDTTGPGPRARLWGRWAGAWIAASVCGCAAAAAARLAAGSGWEHVLFMYCAIISMVGLMGAWAALFAARWRGAGPILAVVLLWIAGHLPWGHASLLPGLAGQVMRTWLPGGRMDPSGMLWAQHGLATVGLLCLASARVRLGTA